MPKKPAAALKNSDRIQKDAAPTNAEAPFRDRIRELRRVKASEILPHPQNWRNHPPEQQAALRAVLESIGFAGAVLCRELEDGRLQAIDGHLRRDLSGEAEVPALVTDLSEAEARQVLATYDPIGAMAGADREKLEGLLAGLAEKDREAVRGLLAAAPGPWSLPSPAGSQAGAPGALEAARASLAQRFGVPPFSVLDARQGYWQERKRAWLGLGIRSEIGRGENLLGMSETVLEPDPEKRAKTKGRRHPANAQPSEGGGGGWAEFNRKQAERQARREGATLAPGRNGRTGPGDCADGTPAGTGTSVFDPVLCELAYRWFCPEGGSVLDPFAGGSVRGIVAGWLGRAYLGIDLRPEQVEANRAQAEAIAPKQKPEWIVGDASSAIEALGKKKCFDFVFSCPPYFDLERYSDDPADLSNAESYSAFRAGYRKIIEASVARLKDNRFACFVVGDLRDKAGFYHGLVRDTALLFEGAGAKLYNDAVLVSAVGSLPIRVGVQFGKFRKLGKTHQNVLCFFKGKPEKIPETLAACEFGELPAPPAEPGSEPSRFGEKIEGGEAWEV